jgi:hypothetical protein
MDKYFFIKHLSFNKYFLNESSVSTDNKLGWRHPRPSPENKTSLIKNRADGAAQHNNSPNPRQRMNKYFFFKHLSFNKNFLSEFNVNKDDRTKLASRGRSNSLK